MPQLNSCFQISVSLFLTEKKLQVTTLLRYTERAPLACFSRTAENVQNCDYLVTIFLFLFLSTTQYPVALADRKSVV